MSTFFGRLTVVALFASGCASGPQPVLRAVPAAADSVPAPEVRSWQTVRVEGSYGDFEMRVPALRVVPASGSSSLLIVDSVAIEQVEKRLMARMAGIARAQAAALNDTTTAISPQARHLAPAIKPGLLGAVDFADGEVEPTLRSRERITAAARLAEKIPGELRLVARTDGTSPAVFDVAIARARRVYHDLVQAAPTLGEREMQLTVRTTAVLPGAPRTQGTVEIHVSPVR